MHSKFSPQPHYHNFSAAASRKGIRHSVSATSSINSVSDHNSTPAMTMKHPREHENTEPSILLLGSDHSKKKRQRTMSNNSERSGHSNAVANQSSNNNLSNSSSTGYSGGDSSNYSPRMAALLTSLEALEDGETPQIQQQWPLGSSKVAPAIPLYPCSQTSQAAAALLKQKQQYTKMGKPLNARPSIHRIEEHPPVEAPVARSSSNSTPDPAQVESRDVSNSPPSLESSPSAATFDAIKKAVAVAAAVTNHETSAFSAAFQHHRATLAAVAVNNRTAFSHSPAATPSIVGAPLTSFRFPSVACSATSTTANTKYNASHLNHRNRPLSIQGPTARQRAIHNAVHSDYKKIYRPLQRPPRLPTAHEALVIAAISTAAAPAVLPICR